MNLELGNGQQAELRERLSYEQAKSIRRAILARDVDPLTFADYDMVLIRAYVERWSVKAEDGSVLSIDDAERAPDDGVIQKIALAAHDLWNGKRSPKDGSARSRSTSPEQP